MPSLQQVIARKIVPKFLRYQISYSRRYLGSKGWHKSVATHQSVNNSGPVPWFTYPAQMMLDRIVQKNHRVFEYGSGNSSTWWANHAAEVISVEHSEKWAGLIRSTAPSNLKVILHSAGEPATDPRIEAFKKLNAAEFQNVPKAARLEHGLLNLEFAAYALEIANYPEKYFDIIVIDGMARVLAAWLAPDYLKDGGFIIFDNSDRRYYNDAFKILSDKGFKRIDFYGSGPVNVYEWCTSIFARNFEFLSVNKTIPEHQLCDIDHAS